MITQVRSERMVVFSDIHLGNPFSSVRRKTVHFLEWASRQGYDICINGDGFDVAQVSFALLGRDVPDVLQALKAAVARGVNVYYVVGNHDIVFEHFLSDWGGFKLAPFLNVQCGPGRFRVEHGHLYDPFFVRFPRTYDLLTWIGGFVLKVSPGLYRAWIGFEKLKSRFPPRGAQGILGESPSFVEAAAKIQARGFDGVVFGHTHHTGSAELPHGGSYFNPGSWMLGSKYVRIEHGQAVLCDFPEEDKYAVG